MDGGEFLIGLCIGIGLAAATGFRVFVPLLVMSLGAHTGYLDVAGNFDWVGSTPALVAFATATALEITAYYVPWIDNALDSLTTPAAVVAGTVATASMITGMDPLLQWAIGLIAGGGTAGTVQLLTVATRATSTATTGGLANPAFSTVEAGTATGLSILAISFPIIAVLLVLGAIAWMVRILVRWRRRPAAAPMHRTQTCATTRRAA